MEAGPLQYLTGELIHAGDRVQYNGAYATVVFLSDGETEEASPGYDDYSGTNRGLVLCDDDGVTTQLSEPDERLYFIDRS